MAKTESAPEVIADADAPFTMAELPVLVEHVGLTRVHGLHRVEGSPHVAGPGQNAACPYAAGLDTRIIPDVPAPHESAAATDASADKVRIVAEAPVPAAATEPAAKE